MESGGLEVDGYEAMELAVVEKEVEIEVVSIDDHPLLTVDKAESVAKFDEELLDAMVR